jgi:hypothetical protein
MKKEKIMIRKNAVTLLSLQSALLTAVLFLLLSAAVSAQSGLEIIVEENASGLTITKSKGTAKTLEIPDAIDGKPVTAIGDGAFAGKGLTEVTIPDSVTNIGDGAFSYNQLSIVTIGNNVTAIGRGAFSGNRLVTVNMGSGVKTIGKGAFSENQLASITLPESLTSIDDYAFFSNRFVSIAIPAAVTLIGEGAFSGNRLSEVAIGSGVTLVRDGAFYNNKISSVTIPQSLETLGKRVFDSRPAGGRVKANINYTDTSGKILYTTANNFDTFYEANGKKPGKYTLIEGSWKLE